jgi:hypothetical protein
MPTFAPPSARSVGTADEERLIPEHRAARARIRLPRLPGVRRLGRRGRLLAGGAAVLFGAALLLVVPAPALDSPLTGLITSQISSEVACPGSLTSPPKITIRGGRIVPQLLRGTFSEIELQLPDLAVSGVKHAAFSATLRDVSQPKPGTTLVGRLDAAITLGFANLPSMPDMPKPTFGRAADGSLTVAITPTSEMSTGVKATLLAKVELHGQDMNVIPQQLVLFGKTIPAAQVAEQTGGVRTEKLPSLPDGLAYKSIVPKPDGLHVALGGTVTEPFSALPKSFQGQDVTYKAENGLLGISISKDLPLIGSIPLTIFTEPRLGDGTLTLVPRSVDLLGSKHQPNDPIAAIVLSQINQADLTRELPALPAGVTYRSVSVSDAGITMAIDGVTVRAFSELPATVEGRPASYGAQDGMLAITTSGAPPDRPMPIVLYARPTISGSSLDLAPQQIQVLGVAFPAQDVLSVIKTDLTTYPLQALPKNLAYRGVEVLPDGLRIAVSGRNVTLTKGTLGGASC